MGQQGAPKVTLNDGVRMPLLGYGTSHVAGAGLPGQPGYEAIRAAIRAGYRFLDTAALYQNEHVVGKAIEDAINEGLVERQDLFVCTKVWCTAHRRHSVLAACKESLRQLGLDYVDLYLIHWPLAYVEHADPINPKDPSTGKLLYSDTHFTETWRGMEDCKQLGLARSIGLSNFNHKMIDEILQMPCRHRPTVNQVECHPYLAQKKLLAYCDQNDVLLNAYCPLGSPGSSWAQHTKLLEEPVIQEVAHKYGKSAAQICLRYQVQRRVAPIPKSVRPDRIKENMSIWDFEIGPDDMARLLALDRGLRYCTNTAGELVHDHPLYPFHEEY